MSNQFKKLVFKLGVGSLLFVLAGISQALNIDTFNDCASNNFNTNLAPDGQKGRTPNHGSIAGGERDLFFKADITNEERVFTAERFDTNPLPPLFGNPNKICLGTILFIVDTNEATDGISDKAYLTLVYDGGTEDDTMYGVDDNGLSLDLTDGGLNTIFRLLIATSTPDDILDLTIYTAPGQYSTISFDMPDTKVAYRNMDISFVDSNWVDTGGGADFTDVMAIELTLTKNASNSGTPLSFQPYFEGYGIGMDNFSTQRQLISSIEASLAEDVNGDGDFDSAVSVDDTDTILYTVEITDYNDRLDASSTAVNYQASFDDNVSFLPGTVTTDTGTIVKGNGGESTVEVDIGDLADGAKATITYKAKIKEGLQGTADQSTSHYGTLTTGEMSALSLGSWDTNPTVTLFNVYDFDVTLEVAPSSTNGDADSDTYSGPGERVTFTAQITNIGPNGLVVPLRYYQDAIENATLVGGSVTSKVGGTNRGSIETGSGGNDTEVYVRVGTVDPAETLEIIFDMLIDDPFPFGFVDSISAQSYISNDGLVTFVPSDDPGDATSDADPTVVLVDAFPVGRPDAVTDNDGDGLPECDPDCPDEDPYPDDTDNDGVPNVDDSDDDGDGTLDGLDAFPLDPDADTDTDSDGMPDTCVNDCADSPLTLDDDDDNDGILDDADDYTPPDYNFYDSRSASLDTDGDGKPDNWNDGTGGTVECDLVCQGLSNLVLDTDDDNDEINDTNDAFPTNKAASKDGDLDGMPDEWNPNCGTTCQNNSGLTLDPSLNDTDNDGTINDDDDFYDNDAADTDSDGDGDPDRWLSSCDAACQAGSGLTLDNDDDNDGVNDGSDDFNPKKYGLAGAVAASLDADQDGYPDEWNAACDLTCQTNSGLTLDPYLNDTNNDGVPNDPGDNNGDDDGDGIPNGEDPDNFKDNNPPVVNAPKDIEITAQGKFTSISLGKATAVDYLDGKLTATPDNKGPFKVGKYVIVWTATDAAGNVGTDKQRVTILAAEEGGSGGGTTGGGRSGKGGSLFYVLLLLMSSVLLGRQIPRSGKL